MIQSADYEAFQRASDPASDPQELAELVVAHPELAGAIRANPACYPALAQYIDEHLLGGVVAAYSPASDGTEPASPAQRKSRLRLIAASAIFALIAGAFGGGFFLGWKGQGELAASQAQKAATTIIPADEVSMVVTAGNPMPDLRGLPQNTAKAILADLDVAADAIAIMEQPAAGPPGIILEQVPQFGVAEYQSATLTVSVQTTVPKSKGVPRDQYIEALAELGAEVTEELTYVPGIAPGVVISTDPVAGELLPASVKIVVAEAPAAVSLASLDSVDGYCSAGQSSIDGDDFGDALTCNASGDGTQVSWVIGRSADRLTATVGIPDTSTPGAKVRVRVYGDGTELKTFVAKYGNSTEIDVPVANVLRLTVTFTYTNSEDSWDSIDVALGDPLLQGGSVAMTDLIGSDY